MLDPLKIAEDALGELASFILKIPAPLRGPFKELGELILAAPNQRAALERAKFYAAADAAKIAVDAELRRELDGK